MPSVGFEKPSANQRPIAAQFGNHYNLALGSVNRGSNCGHSKFHQNQSQCAVYMHFAKDKTAARLKFSLDALLASCAKYLSLVAARLIFATIDFTLQPPDHSARATCAHTICIIERGLDAFQKQCDNPAVSEEPHNAYLHNEVGDIDAFLITVSIVIPFCATLFALEIKRLTLSCIQQRVLRIGMR